MSDYPADDYTEIWETDPPPDGVKYQVVEEEWTDDYTVRRIRRIKLADE